ncbi:hypothetical protein L208DRAFT_1414397 [Tricholoma matsutake]|nr:hypothetical protein L208DRAFT_1414397 [Tricholoma matsutake 945]
MSTSTSVVGIGTSSLDVDALYWAVLISTIRLSGIIISQGWTYAHDNDDKWHLRLLVTVLILADFSITCLSCLVLRYYLMLNYGNVSVFFTLPRYLLVIAGTGFGVAYVSELFFASRVYILDKRFLWAAVVAGLSATAFLGEISYPPTLHSIMCQHCL